MSLLSWPVAPARGDEEEETGDFNASRSDTTCGDQEIELKGDQFEDMTDAKLKLSTLDLWALGITTALGGHYYLWNAGLVTGFGGVIIGFFLIASAYGCLVLCMAELSGALPFAGGAYGIVRVTLGSLPGYLVACFDCYQSMFYTMLSVLLIGYLISFVTESEKKWNPLWWFIIYCSYLVVHTIGGVFFWRTLKTLSIGSLALLVIYILGSIKFANFEENAPLDVKAGHSEIEAWFTGGALKFFQVLPVYCWMFVGVESLNLAAHDAVDPKKDIPKAYVLSYITIFCTALSTIFVACSVSPGVDVLKLWFMPQSFGYQLMFDVDLKTAFILGIPAIYTSGFTFMYYYSSQIRAMGKSGLVNPWLGYDIPYFHTPVPALLFGAIIGFAVGLRYQYYRVLKHEDVFSISLLGAILTYFSQFISFITFRLHYPTIRREFLSPLGIAGAVYGMLVFGIVLVTLLGLEKSPAIIAFGVYLVVLLIYYALVVQKRQVYSDEERTVLFKAYLMKSNRLRGNRVRTGKARARHSTSSEQSGSSGTFSKGIVLHKYDARLQNSSDEETSTTRRIFVGAMMATAGVAGVSNSRSPSARLNSGRKNSPRDKEDTAASESIEEITAASTAVVSTSVSAAAGMMDRSGGIVEVSGEEDDDVSSLPPSGIEMV